MGLVGRTHFFPFARFVLEGFAVCCKKIAQWDGDSYGEKGRQVQYQLTPVDEMIEPSAEELVYTPGRRCDYFRCRKRYVGKAPERIQG